MRETIVAIVQVGAHAAAELVLAEGGDRQAVARAAMQDARTNWMAPEESEAFAGAIGALWQLYPDDQDLRDETRAIGDRNKLMGALMSDIPVNFDALDLQPMPENAIGLLDIWRETDKETAV